MQRIRSRHLAWGLAIAISLFATSAHAADGVIQINDLRAQAGAINGSLGSDPAGYPVRITSSGSYVLTSNLVLSDQNETAIEIAADDVQIDLDGFAIRGVTTCTGFPPSCSNTGSGDGIRCSGTSGNIRIHGGTIRGMGDAGIDCRSSHEKVYVSDVRTFSNGSYGIIASERSSMEGCVAVRNGSTGLEPGTHSVVRQSATIGNGSRGIFGYSFSLIEENVVNGNNSHGIDMAADNTIVGNASSENTGSGIVMPKSLGGHSYGTIRYNAAFLNGSDGIAAGIGTNVTINAANSNARNGIWAGGGSNVLGNAISNNDGGLIFQGGKTDISHGHNNASGNTTTQMGSGNQRIGCDVVGGTQTCP